MADLEALVRLLLRGAEAARGEARRILDELVTRGDLSRAEADEALARVQDAVDANRRWLDERVVAPLRDVVRGAGGALRRALGDARQGARDEARFDEPEGQPLRAMPDEPEGQALRAMLARLAALEERLARIEARLAARGAAADG